MDTAIFILTLIVLWGLRPAKDVRYCLLLWSCLYLADLLTLKTYWVDYQYFFLFNILRETFLVFGTLYLLKNYIKTILIMFVSWIYISINAYEHLSEYQTFLYPYYHIYFWINVELNLLILIWNTHFKYIKFKLPKST